MSGNRNDLVLKVGFDIDRFNSQLNKASSSINKWSGTVISAFNAIGITTGIYGVVNAFRSAVTVLADFEAQMSEVKAISGATDEQFESLKANALDLGRKTRFTSTEVAKLQTEYARLGFSAAEINKVTAATLSLATASKADLAQSAMVAGSTLRGFGLEAGQTTRVTDVMAASFSRTALDIHNFQEAIKYVAPVAAAANVSLEETVAMLGTMANAGIKGSMAGTSLRRILTDLSKDARPASERIAELGANGITMAGAMDEVGRIAQTSLIVLANGARQTDALTVSFDNAAGAAKRMADVMEDNLTGDVIKLTSAFEGLVLQGSFFNDLFRRIVQSGTGVINLFTGARDAAHEYNQAVLAFRTNGSFRDHVFGKPGQLESDLAVLRKLADEAGVVKGLVGPSPAPGLFVPDKPITVKTPRVIDENAIMAQSEMERAARIAILERAYARASKTIEEFTNVVVPKNNEGLTSMGDTLDMLGARVDVINTQIMDRVSQISQQAAELGSVFGNAFGELASGAASASEAIFRAAEGIVASLERIVIGKMIEKAVSGSGPGPVAIFAAAAAFAAGRALFRKLGGSGASGGGAGGGGGGINNQTSRLTPVTVNQGQRLIVEGNFRLQGPDLVAAIDNQNRRNGVIKGS